MRWSLLIAVIGWSMTDVASFAQRPPDDQRLSSAYSSPDDAGFFASSGVVRFQLVQGRLCLDPPLHRKGSQKRDEGEYYESITVTAERGIPSLHYVCQTPDHHLTLSVQQAEATRIESWFPAISERSIIDQPAVGEIVWTSQRGDLEERLSGPTLLHLRQSAPENFDVHFGFLIRRLLRGQSLAMLTEQTRLQLIDQLRDGAAPGIAEIRESVDALGSRRRSTRTTAQRQLLAWGTPIVPILHQMSSGDLDREQRERLIQVMRRLRPRIDDTPATLAKVLVNDASFWVSLGPGLSDEQLRLAGDHLRTLGIDPLVFAAGPAERIAGLNHE